MNLPEVIQQLVKAQNNADSAAFAGLFTENAQVFDEAKTHTGKAAIQAWVEKTTQEYKTVMHPLNFEGDSNQGVLKTEVSGIFSGSPAVFAYNFKFEGKQIKSLKIS